MGPLRLASSGPAFRLTLLQFLDERDYMVDDLITTMRQQLSGVYRGNAEGIDLVLTAMLAGGHVLLEDIPGVGKTTLARALAQVVGGRFQRVQAYPT